MQRAVTKIQNKRLVIGIIALAGFTYLGLNAFQETLTPYVSFAEARSSEGKSVQVSGDLREDRLSWYSDDESRTFLFYMIEPETGDTLLIAYDGIKPSTFDEAVGIVAIGAFDGIRFRASQILTKCPSKYEGQDPAEHDRAAGGK